MCSYAKALNPEVAPGAHLQKLKQPLRTKCPTSSSGCDRLVLLNDRLLDTGCTDNRKGFRFRLKRQYTCPPNLGLCVRAVSMLGAGMYEQSMQGYDQENQKQEKDNLPFKKKDGRSIFQKSEILTNKTP